MASVTFLADMEDVGMPYETHLEHLNQKHDALEQAISCETQRPIPDTIRLGELKRQKLRIKDEINRLAHV